MKRFAILLFVLGLPAPGFAQEAQNRNAYTDRILSDLGTMAKSLLLALSLDGPSNGSVIYSRAPAPRAAKVFGAPRFQNVEGHQCADFSDPYCGVTIPQGISLGTNYTISIWAKAPLNVGWLWSAEGEPRRDFYGDGEVMRVSFRGGPNKGGDYPLASKIFPGWHHIAATSDGNSIAVFVDGELNRRTDLQLDFSMHDIGGIPQTRAKEFGGPRQCGLLDDMLIFDRALTPEEIKTLVTFRLPMDLSGSGAAPPPVEATDLVRTYNNSLVFVTGEGAGSGFVANLGGKRFLLTNAHVAAGVRGAAFQTLSGSSLQPGPASVAVGHDILAMQATGGGTPLEVMNDVTQNTTVGDEVVVLGNAEGGGVINAIVGRLVGVGPDRVEIDAPFLPGNSGSPIIHLKSRKVIGVATYITIRKYDPATKQPIQDPVIRRFGYRIDSVKTWQPVDWRAFYAQANEMENVEKLTGAFIVFVKDLADDGKVTVGAHTHIAIRSRIDGWLASKSKHTSAKDSAAADQNFLAFLKAATQSDVTAARARLTFDYFQRQLAEHQKERAEISTIFSKIIENLASER